MSDPFEERETKQVDVPLFDMFHFDDWIVRDTALIAGLIKPNQEVAYLPKEVVFINDVAHIRFDIKAFDDREELTDEQGTDYWPGFVPKRWAATG